MIYVLSKPVALSAFLRTKVRAQILLLFGLGAAVAGCAEPQATGSEGSDEATAGRKLYITKCAKCHKLYDPAKYSDPDWAVWMNKMAKKAHLNPPQQELLTHYIDETLRSSRESAR